MANEGTGEGESGVSISERNRMSEAKDNRLENARKALTKALEGEDFQRQRKANTKTAIIRGLGEEIKLLHAKGATWAQVSEILRPVIEVSPDTIRLAMAENKAKVKPKGKPRTQRAATPRPSEPRTDVAETKPLPTGRTFSPRPKAEDL